MELFDNLLDDETLVRRPQAPSAAAVVPNHLELRDAYGSQLATLVVPEGQLAEVARHIPAGITLSVSVIISGGAGGLLGLARRKLPGIEIVSAEPGLRDFDDLAGSAARVVSAAAELGSETAIFVELPYGPGWEAAVDLVEAAGLAGKIAADDAEPRQTAEQLSILIEADLPFKITSRSGSSWLGLLNAIAALIDGASIDDAAQLIQSNGNVQISPPVSAGEGAPWSRIRRRVRRFGTDRVADVINEYVAWQSRGR
ncbi:MAG TPA: hypothetical protein VJ625_14200 [Propionibacteriaceae bacterium]|nr:hypothetical protein [Propionibacteriaceae bacterium]